MSEYSEQESMVGRIKSSVQHTMQSVTSSSSVERVSVTMEEAYMIKKQEALNLHCIPCDKIAERFRMVRGADQEDIN